MIVHEHLMNSRGGHKSILLSKEVQNDPKAQRYLKESLINIINKLK